MDLPGPISTAIRFGAFDVDRGSGELRKHGIRIKLQEQPLRILTLLLERPGEVIAREELRQLLWPDGTYVDFERSLNAAVAKLRQALNDSAENPRFIETIPRRGYRFIGIVDAPAGAEAVMPKPVQEAPPKRRIVWGWLGALFATLSLIAAFLFLRPIPDEAPVLTRITSDSGLATDPAISPNGKLIAYASDRKDGTNLDIWVQSLPPAGEPVRLTANKADERQPSFSPDGTKIVYRSDQDGGGIYQIPAGGGEPVLLAAGGVDPRYSPDGATVAYWMGKSFGSSIGAAAAPHSLFLVPASGGHPSEVQTDLNTTGQPIWAPDGKHLIVSGTRIESRLRSDWWVVPARGGLAAPTGALAAFRKQGMSESVHFLSVVPRPDSWVGDSILFSGQFHDSMNLWRVPISTGDWRVNGPARRLTTGSGLEVKPSMSSTGPIAFAGVALSANIWSLPVNANQARVTGPLLRITNGAWLDNSPSVSADGRRISFDSTRSGGKATIWIKELDTGREALLASHDFPVHHPQISHDGSQVEYYSSAGHFMTPAAGGPPEKLCGEECASFSFGWTPDGGSILLAIKPPFGRQLDILDVRTRHRRPFMDGAIFQPRFSPDQRWLTFAECASGPCLLFISPLRDGLPAGRDSWIRISQPGIWSDKPRWSPDGGLIYMISERDGFRCLWAQRLDPNTKHPIGAPIEVFHFHNARLSPVSYPNLEINVAADKIVLNLSELAGNIWTITR